MQSKKIRFGMTLAMGLLTLLVSGNAWGAAMMFDFKDPKEISAVSLTLDSKLEPIVGYAKGISGKVHFDPTNPQAATGSITVEVASIQFANEGYTATARGYALQGDKYPHIVLTLRKVLRVTRSSPNLYQGTIQADFLCKGIMLPLTLPMTASYYPGLAEERTNGKYQGDVLVLRTKFNISRKKLGISQGIPDSLVGDAIEVGVAVVGLHYTTEQKKPDMGGAAPATVPAQKPAVATQPTTMNLWKMEIERRDAPIKADAEFNLFDPNAREPVAVFTTAQGSLRTERGTLTGSNFTFHLADNPQIGEADGEASVAEMATKNSIQGVLITKKGRLRFHARRKCVTDDIFHPLPARTVQGPGFRDLVLQADGANQTLAARMQFHHVPAVSIARFENYKVVEIGAFGVTNAETGELVDTDTLFQAGSMGSPLVNLLTLRLAAQNRLDLNREANAYLKSTKIADNAFTQTRKITVLDLMKGASGLSQYKFTGYPPTAALPTLASLLAGADPTEMEPLQAARMPGTFGGEGVCGALLEQVIVDATGRPFAELMQKNIFVPFEMTHSTYNPAPQPNTWQKVALGHYSTGELMLDKFHVYPEAGETGLWTTAGDFARALCQVQLLLAGKPNRILKAEEQGLLKSVLTENWLLGLIRGDGKGVLPADYLYHGGSSYGYYANHATHAWNGSGVVVMENRILGWGLNNEIIHAVGEKYGWLIHQAQLDQPVTLDVSLPEIRADKKAVLLNLAQRQGAKHLVLFFFSEQCGVTFHYKQRLQQLQSAFESKGFTFIGVRCGKREKPDEPLELAGTRYLRMPFVDDRYGTLANAFHVRQSLTFAVLDPVGKLRYYGGFDNNVAENLVTHSYLPEALRALAAGKQIAIKEGHTLGCAIIPIQ